MKPHKKLSIVFAAAILTLSAVSPQEKVAVLPPQVGKTVTEINKKTVRSTFLSYISEPGSGFAAFESHIIDMMVQRETGGQPNMLYDEKVARDIGKKLGVPLVCIIDLTRDEHDFLIECKLVSVDTGRAVSKSEVTSGLTNAELKRASEAVIKKLMAGSGAITTSSAPTASAAVRTEPTSRAAATTTSTPSQAAVRAEPPSKATAAPSEGNVGKTVNEPMKSSKPEAPKTASVVALRATRKNWEYKTAAKVATKNIDETLKSLGDERWELVAATMNGGGLGADSHNLFFKRPKN
jgi:hypothetical protein